MDDNVQYMVASREQILRYRALTTLLSWIGCPVKEFKPCVQDLMLDRSKGSYTHGLYHRACEISDLLIRDNETITVSFDEKFKHMKVLKVDDKEVPSTASYLPVPSENKLLQDLPLPHDSIGDYLQETAKGTKKDLFTLDSSSFAEHASTVLSLLKRSHNATDALNINFANRDTAEYVWMSSEPVIRKRIAVGGAPQIHKRNIHRRNLFWVLTRTPETILQDIHDANDKYPEGVEYCRWAFEQAMVPASMVHTKLNPKATGVPYNDKGRLQFQTVLAGTLAGLWLVFEKMAITKEKILLDKYLWESDNWMGTEAEYIHEMSDFGLELDNQTKEANRHMFLLRYFVVDDRSILSDHLQWLKQVYDLEDTRDLCFNDAFFSNVSKFEFSCMTDWNETEPDRDSSVLTSTMDDIPQSRFRSDTNYDPAKDLETDWVAAAMRYLERLTHHMHALQKLLKCPTKRRRQTKYQHVSHSILNLSMDCLEIQQPDAFDNEMLPIAELLRTTSIFGQFLNDDEIETLRCTLECPMSSYSTSLFYNAHLFEGQHHGEGLLWSLHLAHRFKTTAPQQDTANQQQEQPHVVATAAKLSRKFAWIPNILPSSKNCCPGCLSLVKYIDHLDLLHNPDIPRSLTGRPQVRWSPCTIPPWTPWGAAAYMIEVAEYEVLKWAVLALAKVAEGEKMMDGGGLGEGGLGIGGEVGG